MANEAYVPPGTWTLIFSGSTLITSHFVQSWRTQPRRLTPIARRQNLWSSSVIIDGRYPAQIWTHDFLVYTEALTPTAFAQRFVNLEDQFTEAAQQLTLKDNGTDRFDLGSCLLEPPSQDNPRELLLFRAGFLKLRFLGTAKPLLL